MPLRSASDFPSSPAPEALEGTYQECRAALVSANRSRVATQRDSDIPQLFDGQQRLTALMGRRWMAEKIRPWVAA
jgi:hypothetical protein